MRGTALRYFSNAADFRFIPDHAGNRFCSWMKVSTKTVYPRPCGEQVSSCASLSFSGGLSPTMRGTARSASCFDRRCRFIPDHAGNRSRHDWPTSGNAVYPRPCGEQPLNIIASTIQNGLSPTMRGTAFLMSPDACQARFIPDHAGNSSATV